MSSPAGYGDVQDDEMNGIQAPTQQMKISRKETKYAFVVRTGQLLTEKDLDELAHMVAVWIYRGLRYKKERAIISQRKEE